MPGGFLRRMALRLRLMRWYPTPTGIYLYLALLLPDAVRLTNPVQPPSAAGSIGMALLCIACAYWFFPWQGNFQYFGRVRTISSFYRSQHLLQLVDAFRSVIAISLALAVIYLKLKHEIYSLNQDLSQVLEPLHFFTLYSPIIIGLADYVLSPVIKRRIVAKILETEPDDKDDSSQEGDDFEGYLPWG